MFKNPYWFKHCRLTDEQRRRVREYEKELETRSQERVESIDLSEYTIVPSFPDVTDVQPSVEEEYVFYDDKYVF